MATRRASIRIRRGSRCHSSSAPRHSSERCAAGMSLPSVQEEHFVHFLMDRECVLDYTSFSNRQEVEQEQKNTPSVLASTRRTLPIRSGMSCARVVLAVQWGWNPETAQVLLAAGVLMW